MLIEKRRKEELIAKYRPLIERGGGGIFTTKTRKRLVGILGLSGRDRTLNDFWYDVRNRVKNALIDLELFVEVAGTRNVDQVLTAETLKPVTWSLLWKPPRSFEESNVVRAWIAKLLIDSGFYYLEKMSPRYLTKSHKRTIDEAKDLSRFLAESIKREIEVANTIESQEE